MNQMKAGAILSYVSIGLTILVALIYTPIMIRLLGQAEYGLYALIGSVAAYFSILDMGLGNAIVRYTARNRAIGDKKSEENLNGMFLILYSIIGFITIIAGVILYNTIDNIFAESLNIKEIQKAQIMIIILTINFALSFPLAVFGSIMQAYEKFIVVKVIGIIRSLLIPFLTLPVLFVGYGSVSMVLITSIVNISCLLINVYYCFKYLKIRIKIKKIDYLVLKEILGYSFFVFLGIVVDQLYWNTDQVILGIVAGTVPVAIYAIAMQFIRLYMQFSTSIGSLFLPKVTMMVANKASSADLTLLMVKYGRIQFVIMSFILSGVILFGQFFINIWAGEDYNEAYYILLIVMVPLTIPLIQNIGLSILYAKNLQKFRSMVLIFIVVLNVIITIPLAENFGGIGAACATAMSLTLGNVIIMNFYYHRKIGIDMLNFWFNIFQLSLPIIVSLVIGLVINSFIPSSSILDLVFKIAFFTILFFVILFTRGLNRYEKQLIISVWKKLRNVILKVSPL